MRNDVRTLVGETATALKGEIRKHGICLASIRGNPWKHERPSHQNIVYDILQNFRCTVYRRVELEFPYAKAALTSPPPATATGALILIILTINSMCSNSFTPPNHD